MNWKKRLAGKRVRRGISILLVLVILAGLLIPLTSLTKAQPENPLQDETVQEIETLSLGKSEIEEEKEDIDADSPSEKSKGTQSEKSEDVESSEVKPKESQKNETEPEEKPEDSGAGDGEQGAEDGIQGEEGGEEAEVELDLGMVMTWYKYGTQPKTIVCGPSDIVSGKINTAQLVDDELKYSFQATGKEADKLTITSVQVKVGDGVYQETEKKGTLRINLPNASAGREYTFQIDAVWKTKDSTGKRIEQDVTFTYVLNLAYALDLELELSWTKTEGRTGKVSCAVNETQTKTIDSYELEDQKLAYTVNLTGALAENAKIIRAEYTTASGESGLLEQTSGSLKLHPASGSKEETYYFTFEAQLTDEDGEAQSVFYHITFEYVETLDLQLSFTWWDRGVTPKKLICQPEGNVSEDVKNNQLSAGAVKYEMVLEGSQSENARILNIFYTSDASGGGKLEESGALPVALPEGYSSNTYTIRVIALVSGQQVTYEIVLHYTLDVSLQMSYVVKENGMNNQRTVMCENGKSKTADAIYDNQLVDGELSYEMTLVGMDSLAITSVLCYQSGSKSRISLESTDQVQLLLENGKTGENAFEITAEDENGTAFTFDINIPYKHRGENIIKISTNMTERQVVTNETETNLSVAAWSEDENGEIVSYIPANGTDTKLIVKLDGETLQYVSTSGKASEYILYPENPVTGDTNEHTLYIYAEDGYGNYGELTLTLQGQRNQAGQKKGTAMIYIDMTVLGLGVVDSLSYEVLADEPISYVVAKAVLGEDTGEPFGKAAQSLGWKGSYTGTLDIGFYLQSLSPGMSANSLNGSSWNQYGSNEQEILQAIDDQFGAGTGLATLWRCIYRNGLNKSSGVDGTYGEHDFTNGSGWLFSLNGTYYPGLSMSEYSLEDGDVLTLRYTIAHGWEVGGGTPGYGKTLGYCVTALNGSYYINHQMEEVEQEDGSIIYMCKCCGLVEGCAHEHVISQNQGDGTHISYCEDCKTTIGDPIEHTWECLDDAHTCTECEASEAHTWKEVSGSNTATCTQSGTRTVNCTICAMTRKEESAAKGHTLDNRWNHTNTEHYQKCSTCDEVIAESVGMHQYEYNEGDDDWYCVVCEAGHDWDYCGNGQLTIDSATCGMIVYYCSECGMYLTKSGYFPEYHSFADGFCTQCGEASPDQEIIE